MLHWQYESQEGRTQTMASASVDDAFVIIETPNCEKKNLESFISYISVTLSAN